MAIKIGSGGDSVKNIYVWVDVPAYTYSYDFRDKSEAQLNTDGWIITQGTLVTGSSGIASAIGADVNVWKTIGEDLSTAKKITITYTTVWNRDDIGKRYMTVGLNDSNASWNDNAIFTLSTGYTTTKVSVADNGTTAYGTDLGDIGQSTYTPTFEIDLVNKTMKGTVTGLGTSTFTLTDSQVTAIRSLTKIGMYTTQRTFYLQDINLVIEY